MGATYGGTVTFTLQKRQLKSPVAEMPTAVETWQGANNDGQLENFLALYPVGLAYGGGYVIDADGEYDGMWGNAILTIGLPPDFNTAWINNSTSTKNSTKSATVDASNVIDGADSVNAVKTVSYYSPETRYKYFSSSKPSGARYSTVATAAQPVIIRSVIKATDADTSSGSAGAPVTFTGLLAPAPLVSALVMSVVDVVTATEADVIPGTPWYQCVDTVSREFQGDAS